MATGRLFLAAALSLSTCAAMPPVLRADDAAPSESKKEFVGVVNANAVFVRSHSSEDAYPTMRLARGSRVTVVDLKGNWLKIVPPEGSFAYVPKSFVNLRNDGTVGRTTKEVIVRAGSELNEMAAFALVTLPEGEDVQVIGQHNEYFKIKPPKGSYLWINRQFVDPAPREELVADADDKPKMEEANVREEAPPITHPHHPEVAAANDATASNDRGPATRPAAAGVDSADAATAPSTQPAYSAVTEYERLEQQFADAATKPIAEQPLPDLLAGYQKVMDAEDLPSSMRQIAAIRVATLKVRNDARSKFLALRDEQKKAAEKRQSLIAERQEIEQRIRDNDIQIFAALGTLRTSSLQVGQGTLYRLTDPATGRTVAYIRTNDAKYGGYLGQFIGIRGAVTADPQLKSVIDNPVEVKPINVNDVNTKVAAQLSPPSLTRFARVPAATIQPTAPAPPPTVNADAASPSGKGNGTSPSPSAASGSGTTPPSNNTASTGGEEPQ